MNNTLPKRYILSLFFLMTCFTTMSAQQMCTVRGTVKESGTKDQIGESLPFASIMVLNAKDSTLVKRAESDKNGDFMIQFPTKKGKRHLLKVSYLGFMPTFRLLQDSASTIRLGTILLEDAGVMMNEVVVNGKLPEVTMKGDTTEIHADAFKTPEGSTVKDLVKRIPGLDYDEENQTLTYNGKPLKEINVNGEAFFLGNIQIALEKLPAKFVSKLRVYDKKTKKEEATGIKEGTENYVLDLQTKKELNNTILADAKIGGGNNEKKELDGSLNYFRKGGENISVYARSSNRDMNSTYKNNIQNSAGMNVTRHFGKKVTLNGNMSYNMNRSGNISTSYNELYMKGGDQYSSSENSGSQTFKSLSSFMNLQWKMNKRINLNLAGGYGMNQNQNSNTSQSATFDAPPGLELADPFAKFDEVPDSIKINRSKYTNSSASRFSYYHFMANLTYKLNEKGTNLNFSLQNSSSNGKNENTSESNTTYYRLKDTQGNDSILYRNQYQWSPSDNRSWNAGVSFTHPIKKNLRLQLSYGLRNRLESSDRDTYDISLQSKAFVDSLSNRSNGHTLENQAGVLLNYSDTIWTVNAMFSVAPQKRSIDRKMGLQYADTTMNSTNLMSNVNLNWKKKDNRLNLSYNFNTNQPSLSSLMPLTDNSNPLYISSGNPDLKASVNHYLRINFDNSRKGLAAYVNFNIVQNSITQVTSYNEVTGGRVTWPININGNWNVNAMLRGMKKWGKFSVNLEGSGTYRNSVGMINENLSANPERSTTRDTRLQARLRLSYQPKWGGFNLSNNYNFNHSLNTLRDNNSYSRNYDVRFDGYVEVPGGVQVRTNIGYILRNGTNLQKSDANEVNWNAGAVWRFLKEKKAELGVYWSDILGQAKDYGRTATADGLYEYHSQQTRGYIMATLKYNFRIIK